LACLLLKLGGYGLVRVLLGFFGVFINSSFPIFSVFCTCGVVYCSLSAIIQIDLKKLVAYASVSHMNLILLGLVSRNVFGVQGGIFMMLGHGLVSALLFFLIGFLYDRHQTRNVLYFAGLAQPMPVFSTFFFLAVLGNVAMPLTCNFIGEFLILLGVLEHNL